ncbi:hypothetical protein WJX72_000561 [[Myrmecia] bisecta]|uniref:CSC1/OSCA1-like cytosolic domain-containing protein n=1 Tax=[Myrmecia] bisecta TaxID=41462 RepID=A0AAW1P6U0_9CHLO
MAESQQRSSPALPEVGGLNPPLASVRIVRGNSKISGANATPKLSRTLAHKRRDALLLYEYSRDAAGLPIGGTQRAFQLTASPRQIGQESVGLGVYFTSIILFALLALALSILAIYPIVDNYRQTGYAKYYTVFENQIQAGYCPKTWDVANGIMQTTIGSFCADPHYSSKYTCAASCYWESSKLDQVQCAGLPNRLSYVLGYDFACLAHRPCVPGLQNVTRADGPCYCCDLVLNVGEVVQHQVHKAQLWVLFVAQLAFLLWMLLLNKVQVTAAEQINASVLTAGDYTVLIRGIGPHVTNQDIMQWCSHYGEVVSASQILSIGSALAVAKKLHMLQMYQAELEAEALAPSRRGRCCLLHPFQALYWHLIGRPAKIAAAVHRSQAQLQQLQAEPLVPTGDALVTFNYELHAQNCVADHYRAGLRHAFHVATCNNSTEAPTLGTHVIQVHRAPEPTDIWWENSAVRGRLAWKLRCQSAAMTLAIVLAGAVIQYALSVAAENERNRRMNFELMIAGTKENFAQVALNAAKLRAIAIVSSIFVVAMNAAIRIAVRQLTLFERWPTRSDTETWHVIKLSVFYLVNSFLVPVLAVSFSENTETWYSKGGLIEQAFYIQLANAVLPAILDLIGPVALTRAAIFASYARTQRMLDHWERPEEFLLAEHYAAAVKTLGLAMFFMPALPLSFVIACGGLTIQYWSDKYLALRKAEKPSAMSHRMTVAIDMLIRLLPLVQLILMHQLYFAGHPAISAVFWTGFALWLLCALAPLKRIVRAIRPHRPEEPATAGLSFFETIGKAAAVSSPHSPEEPTAEPLTPLKAGVNLARPELYVPQVPAACSAEFREEVMASFATPAAPYPADPTLLDGQNPRTGGHYTRPPPKRSADHIYMAATTAGAAFAAHPFAGGRPPLHAVEMQPAHNPLAAAHEYATQQAHPRNPY